VNWWHVRSRVFLHIFFFLKVDSKELELEPMLTGTTLQLKPINDVHPKTLIELWITCLDPVSANSEKCIDSQWAVRVGQRLQSRFGQSGAAR